MKHRFSPSAIFPFVLLLLMAACKNSSSPKPIDQSMLLGEWVTVHAENEMTPKNATGETRSLDSAEYRFISLSIEEGMIESTEHIFDDSQCIPIMTGALGNYYIDSNNALWGYGADGRLFHEFDIIELTSDRLVFQCGYVSNEGNGIATYTMKRRQFEK